MKKISVILCALLCAPAAQAQQFALRVDTTAIAVTRDVEFARADTFTLRFDAHRAAAAAARPLPALIFFNRATGQGKRWPIYTGWANAAAARGLVGIIPDLRAGNEIADFERLLQHLKQHGSRLGIDTAAIAVYAASSNAGPGLPMVQNPATTGVKAAVIYYGLGQVQELRGDLPMLMVRAGLDRPPLNQAMAAFAQRALSENVPLTMLNHPSGYHGFEVLNDDDATRDVIERTLAFVKHATSPGVQSALRTGAREAAAAGFIASGNAVRAAELYRDLVAERPALATLRLAYGGALLANREYAIACSEFAKLKDKGLGPRDLGLPAARACAGSGDANAAVEWLNSIPARFLPPSVKDDPAFAAIRDRADFKAVFERRE